MIFFLSFGGPLLGVTPSIWGMGLFFISMDRGTGVDFVGPPFQKPTQVTIESSIGSLILKDWQTQSVQKNHPILGVDDHRMFAIPFEENGTMVIHPPGRLQALAKCTAGPKGADSENRLSGEKFNSMTWHGSINASIERKNMKRSLLFESSIPIIPIIPVSHFHVPPESWKLAHS